MPHLQSFACHILSAQWLDSSELTGTPVHPPCRGYMRNRARVADAKHFQSEQWRTTARELAQVGRSMGPVSSRHMLSQLSAACLLTHVL